MNAPRFPLGDLQSRFDLLGEAADVIQENVDELRRSESVDGRILHPHILAIINRETHLAHSLRNLQRAIRQESLLATASAQARRNDSDAFVVAAIRVSRSSIPIIGTAAESLQQRGLTAHDAMSALLSRGALAVIDEDGLTVDDENMRGGGVSDGGHSQEREAGGSARRAAPPGAGAAVGDCRRVAGAGADHGRRLARGEDVEGRDAARDGLRLDDGAAEALGAAGEAAEAGGAPAAGPFAADRRPDGR